MARRIKQILHLVARDAGWRIEAGAIRLVLGVLRALGPVRASNLAGGVAAWVGPKLPVSRVADTNLRLALPEFDHAARRRIVRGVWENLGRTMGELPHLADLQRTETGPGWEISGAQHLQHQALLGGPAIFFSGHIGNWEMLPPMVAAFGMRMSSAYRRPANPRVDRIINELRARAMGGPVPMFAKGGAGARAALKHLADGGYLGLLMDQKLNDGIAVPFFGHMAMTAPSMAVLALRFRCPVIPGRVVRVGPARLRLEVSAPLPLPQSADRQADVMELATQMNRCLEDWIRDWPQGWLWLHRRWPKPLYRKEDRKA